MVERSLSSLAKRSWGWKRRIRQGKGRPGRDGRAKAAAGETWFPQGFQAGKPEAHALADCRSVWRLSQRVLRAATGV